VEIGASIRAELIAVRRGHMPEPGWVPRATPSRASEADDRQETESELSKLPDHTIHREGRSR